MHYDIACNMLLSACIVTLAADGLTPNNNQLTSSVNCRRWALHWRHNDHDGVSNHQPHGCLLNRLFRRWSKKTSKFRVTGLCVGNSPGPMNSLHKGPVTRKVFPFDDVIMRGGKHDNQETQSALMGLWQGYPQVNYAFPITKSPVIQTFDVFFCSWVG